MFSWEQSTGRFLDGIGLRSIRSKIIVFALLATLIPSVTMGWLSYRNNRGVIDGMIGQRLTGLSWSTGLSMDWWWRRRTI